MNELDKTLILCREILSVCNGKHPKVVGAALSMAVASLVLTVSVSETDGEDGITALANDAKDYLRLALLAPEAGDMH